MQAENENKEITTYLLSVLGYNINHPRNKMSSLWRCDLYSNTIYIVAFVFKYW